VSRWGVFIHQGVPSTSSFGPLLQYKGAGLQAELSNTNGMRCFTAGLFSVLGLVTRGVSAACAGNLLVDNFTNFGASLNSLGQYASG